MKFGNQRLTVNSNLRFGDEVALKRTKPPNSHRHKLPLKPLNGSGTADGDR